MGKRVLWTADERSYLRESFAKQMTNSVITKGLKEKFNSERTEAAVGAQRFKMSHEDEAAKPKKKGRRNYVRKATAKTLDEIKKSSKPITLEIPEVETVKSIRKGQYAYHPECGVVVSHGIVKIDSYGETVFLEEVYPSRSPRKFRTPKDKIESKNIRALHSAETMENILEFLASNPDVPSIRGRTKDKVDYMDTLLRDVEIKSQIEAVLRVYSDKSTSKGSYVEMGIEALHRLSGEYAAATGTPFTLARQQFKQALGLKSAEQLAAQPRYGVMEPS